MLSAHASQQIKDGHKYFRLTDLISHHITRFFHSKKLRQQTDLVHLSTNQRPVSRSPDHSWPIRGQISYWPLLIINPLGVAGSSIRKWGVDHYLYYKVIKLGLVMAPPELLSLIECCHPSYCKLTTTSQIFCHCLSQLMKLLSNNFPAQFKKLKKNSVNYPLSGQTRGPHCYIIVILSST